ncbi:MAG: hypothetical protein AB9833_05825 [Bacteroidales bacterium]
MKKVIINIFLSGFLLFPVILWLLWVIKPIHKTNILIIDKTVLTRDAIKHQTFNWILSHFKYVKPDGSFYSVPVDYLGFFPLKDEKFIIKDLSQFSETQIDSLASKTDLTFFTDTYGIYHHEWFGDSTGAAEHSEKVYGGLDSNDVLFIKSMMKNKKLILAEFNFFATPTTNAIRAEVENLLGLKWSGWSGRYYEQLDTIENPELPKWIVRLYKKQHNNRWPFTNSGIVFVHSDETIEILEMGTDLDFEVPVVKSFDYTVSKFSVPKKINYPYWFDITLSTNTNNRVLSYYEISANERGDSILRENNIPKIFPAAFENLKDSRFYYFCGDFTDSPIYKTPKKITGIQYLKLFVLNENDLNDRTPFFWRYTLPMTSKILYDYFHN